MIWDSIEACWWRTSFRWLPDQNFNVREGGETVEERSIGASWYRPAHPSLAMCVLSVGTKALYSEHWTTTTTGKFACKATLPEEDWMVGWREEGGMNACVLGVGQLKLPDSINSHTLWDITLNWRTSWFLTVITLNTEYLRLVPPLNECRGTCSIWGDLGGWHGDAF